MVTVSDLLRTAELDLRPVVPGDRDAPVRWVATSELADPTPFLEGGEVLLTTGIGTEGWHAEWEQYVDRLAAAGVAALGLAAGLTHPSVPAALAAACARRGLALFEVPRPTTFVTISRAVARMLGEQEAGAARQALALQRELTQAALRRDDPGVLLQRLARTVRGAAGILGADGRWEAPPVGEVRHGLDEAALAARLERMRPQGLRASTVASGAAGTVVVQPLGLRGSPSSYLAVWAPGRLDDARRSAVTTAVALLSLAVASRNDRGETGRRLRRRAVELLLDGDPRTAAVVLGATLDRAPEDQPAPAAFPARLQLLVASGTEDRRGQAMTRLEDEAGAGPLPLAAEAGEELWVVCEPAQAGRVGDLLVAAGTLVGVGGAARNEELSGSLAAARHALTHAGEGAPLVRWDRLVGTGVLALLGGDAADAFAEAFLAPLQRYGDRRGELEQTLRAFLRLHGRVGPLAEELGVHRNTVRNRLSDVEAALGASLDDVATRVNAWVALELHATRRVRDGR